MRMSTGVLGNRSDLYLTSDHALSLDDCLVTASVLVNGDSIRFVTLAVTPDRYTVYNVETGNHEVILTNGAAAAAFGDSAGRNAFDNAQDNRDLYDAERVIREMD